jgi:tetratricopeptide (TPR) repeat protein
MTQDPAIQCESCGTLYSDLDDYCPYCGQPHPALLYDESPADEPFDDSADESADWIPAGHDDLPASGDEYPDEAWDNAYDPAGDSFVDEDAYLEDDQLWPDDDAAYEDLPPDDFDESAGVYPAAEADDIVAGSRSPRRRLALGCLGVFLCIGLFYGGIGLLGAYHGLQERSQQIQNEAMTHYQQGQAHLADKSIELAIAEFELALSLNPNLLAAREALRDTQRAALALPTPTSQTRTAAAESVFQNATILVEQENYLEAVQVLSEIRDLDPEYKADKVSGLIFTANYQLALQLISPDSLQEVVQYLETALSEQPDNPDVSALLDQAILYLQGQAAASADIPAAIEAYSRLYQRDNAFLDVEQRLTAAYEAYADTLFEQESWCEAEAMYGEAAGLQVSNTLSAKIELSARRCQEQTPAAAARTATPASSAAPRPAAAGQVTATPEITATTAVDSAPTGAGSGAIYFSAYNASETRWEILAVPAGGGASRLVTIDGAMPAVSPNGRLLLYRSERSDSEGFHIFDMTSGEDRRITIFRQHMLPRWGGDNQQFLFTAQEPATKLWKIQLGFADGKGDPVILHDGRTPDWSPDNSLVVYQGADPAGNNPGLYLLPFGGGETTRLTNHESDRSPDFSPDGAKIAYMSTRAGNWDIYVVDTAGSAPRQLTTNPSQDGLPVWSPDGSRLAYVSDSGGSWAIFTISANGGEPTRLAVWDGVNQPDWLLAQIWWGR